ncbi:hypothetical protein K2173_014215 [Erythroxylum novogranatense]|uniref:RNase H type-1 domain-containing protein n=1 Tax=Erythroxylum novogranatense TaxID=1862640 RepID=A0AAV8SEE1_9ROSI|nr:hypothetical protein K2173_014215 [Erythroxylum novogranatense]
MQCRSLMKLSLMGLLVLISWALVGLILSRKDIIRWCGGYVANIGLCPILMAEIWGVLYGLRQAKALGFSNLIVECDNKVAVDMIVENCVVNSCCASLIKLIRSAVREFATLSFAHIHREANFAADFLSHLTHDHAPGFHSLPIRAFLME